MIVRDLQVMFVLNMFGVTDPAVNTGLTNYFRNRPSVAENSFTSGKNTDLATFLASRSKSNVLSIRFRWRGRTVRQRGQMNLIERHLVVRTWIQNEIHEIDEPNEP